jgi:hypothetical protein
VSPRRQQIVPGSLWVQEILGSRAIYEVIADRGEHIDVEVRQAPGLVAGTRIRLTRTAVAAMQPLPDEGPAARGADS